MRKIVVATLVFVLAGCSSGRVQFIKEGASLQEQMAYRYDCEKDLRTVAYSFGRFDEIGMKTFYARCMIAHGWSVRVY